MPFCVTSILSQVYLGSWLSYDNKLCFDWSQKFSSTLGIGSLVSKIAEIFLISNLIGPYARFICICTDQSRKLI